MKHKLFLYIVIFSLLLIISFLLSSCEKADIYDLINVQWTSSDFQMEFIILDKYEGFGSIICKGQKFEYYIDFGLGVIFSMIIKPDENPPTGADLSFYDDASGSYEYSKKEKKLVLSFYSENTFGESFSTITLTATEIDPLEIDPKDRYYVGWISETPNMRFFIRKGDALGGSGIVQIGDIIHMIFFEWNADKKFSVYLLDENGDKKSTSVMDGSYSGSAISLEIILIKDELFGGHYQSITFKPDKDMSWYKKAFYTSG
jgi:hypothetical protein